MRFNKAFKVCRRAANNWLKLSLNSFSLKALRCKAANSRWDHSARRIDMPTIE